MTKILIVGIGGVGGYFGGLLAKAYHSKDEIQILFLSRGRNLQKIKTDGIKVFDNKIEFIAHPNLISDDVHDFGVVDYVLICTKTYSLSQVANEISPCINDNTTIVPLQNGVNSRNILHESFKSNLICNGCVYLVSRLEEPGVIRKKGVVASLHFGLNGTIDERFNILQAILRDSEIKSELCEDIDQVTWEKFIFLSSIATATTYFDSNILSILNNESKLLELKALIHEVTELALAKKINIGKNQTDRVIKILHSLPSDATSSMHSDFINNSTQTELESLTGYIIDEGKLNQVNIKTFEKMYLQIKNRANKAII